MGKLKKLITATKLLMRKPYLLNNIIDDNVAWREKVERNYGLSNGFDEIDLRTLSKGEEVIVKPFAFLEGGSLPTDLALLKLLASTFDDCKYFEIGTWRGESVANVASVANECYTLNLSDNEMAEMGLEQKYIDQQGMFLKDIDNIVHIKGNSLSFDYTSLDRKFDLIFIDGDHHFSSIKTDTENVFRHLVHEHSIVVWHDYAWQPGDIRYETLAAILEGTPDAHKNNLFAVGNTMCAVYYPGAIDAHKPKKSIDSVISFEVKIR
jgi:predicted O-methyltransferase YrrM